MKRLTVLTAILFGISQLATAQYFGGKTIPDLNEKVRIKKGDQQYLLSTTITAAEMSEHLHILASDDFQGRETGTEGIEKAAQYISRHLDKMRLPKVGEDNSHYQNVAFTFTSWGTNEVTVGDQSYRQLWDYIGFPNKSISQSLESNEMIFAGYGISTSNYDDYANKDVAGKIVLVFDGAPNEVTVSEGPLGYEEKRQTAHDKGAAMLLIISNDIKAVINANRRLMVNRVTELGDKTKMMGDNHTNMLLISTNMAKQILGETEDQVIANRDMIKKTGQPQQSISVTSPNISFDQVVDREVLIGKNILGYIEGTDLKDELIIVSAHYDHVGVKGDEVYNGADDNGSGTTTVLEIAEALVTAKVLNKGPRRSVLCLWMTGEEKGLLGSEYYVNNPVFPVESTVADVNIDMVGRWGEEYLDKERSYLYVIGSDRLSSELHAINESVNQQYGRMVLDYKYNDANDPNRFYFRSDHYNFAKNGIPAIFYFNGVHQDYHRLTDSVEKIDFDLMQDRGRFIFHTVWQLANQDKRIEVDKS